MTDNPLDRPVWNCLNGPQAALALGGDLARRIDPGYGPFAAACDASDEALAFLSALVGPGDVIWLVEAEEWPVPPGLSLIRTAPIAQMIAQNPQELQPGDEACVPLAEGDAADMTALALATEPGPWGEKTRLYGQFYGLRDAGKLAAMAGERMRPALGFAEVSGVCTWPDYRGQGLAGKLIRQVMAGFAARGDIPFLHSYAGNAGAIRLYQSLGFEIRREMVAMVLARL